MTAPAPREERIGQMSFVQNNYSTPDLFGPNGGFPQRTYKELILDLQGVLTIAGGAVDGIPVAENPRTLIKGIEVLLTGTSLGDSFISVPLTDLVVLNMIADKNQESDPTETPCATGGVSVTNFRGIYRLPFWLTDMLDKYKTYFVSGRPGISQVNFRIKWGSAEDLVAGGDRTKTLTATSVTIYGRDYTGVSFIESRADLLYYQRIAAVTKTLNATAGTDQDVIIPRSNSFLRGLMLKQYTTDANGVETPIEGAGGLLRPTDPIIFILNTLERKYDLTWEQIKDRNLRDYKRPMPLGYAFIDMSPDGDEAFILPMLMTNYSEIKLRFNNAAVANANLRVTLSKLSYVA